MTGQDLSLLYCVSLFHDTFRMAQVDCRLSNTRMNSVLFLKIVSSTRVRLVPATSLQWKRDSRGIPRFSRKRLQSQGHTCTMRELSMGTAMQSGSSAGR
jgi:hypothetical protein